MKKTIAIIAMLILTLCHCSAEEISFRNGIIFGMKPDEVFQTEEFVDVKEYGSSYECYGLFSTYDAIISFNFDHNEKLYSIYYMIKNPNIESFEAIQQLLTYKYGNPHHDTSWMTQYSWTVGDIVIKHQAILNVDEPIENITYTQTRMEREYILSFENFYGV